MAIRRCPLCHRANEASAWRCDGCGYEFGQDYKTLRVMLMSQRRNARIGIAVLLPVLAGFAIMTWVSLSTPIPIGLPIIGFGFTLWRTLASLRRLAISRSSLQFVDEKTALPTATIVER
jgi:hypothetical protein